MRSKTADNLSWRTIRPSVERLVGESASVIEAAIRSSEALRSFLTRAAQGKGEPLLIVNDPYRATQTRLALAALADHLRALGLHLQFRAVVATGTHKVDPPRRRDFENRVFTDCGLTIGSIDWHEADNAQTLVDVGGVRLNRAVAEARCILAIGSVEPHYFAGVTGAHKTLTIGCMAQADIEANHAHALRADSCILRTRGNPVYDGVAQVVHTLVSGGRQLCVINEVICNDAVVAVTVGDPLATLDELMPAMRRCFVYEIEKPVDILRLRVPPPLGRNFYQADKALKNNGAAVRKGGGILLEANCEEGIGPRRFIDLLRSAATYAESCTQVARDGYQLGDHKAVKLRHLTDPACEGVHVAIASSYLRADDLAGTGLHVFEDVDAAMEWLMRTIKPEARAGLVVDDAGNFCPCLFR